MVENVVLLVRDFFHIKYDSNRFLDSIYHDCEIRGTQALYQRLAAALRVGPISTELVQAAGLQSMGLVNLSSYYLK